MNRLGLQARGKINLVLDVLGRRPDGYHEVSMVMQSISLADEIRLECADARGIHLETSDPSLPAGPENLGYQAAELLFRLFNPRKGVRIRIEKRIPVAAGLAGGSADAAGVLLGLNRLWDLGLDREELAKLALKLGADVPFCLQGGTALAEGVGERLTPLPGLDGCWLVLVKPPFPVSTAEVYREWDRLSDATHPDTGGVVRLIRSGEPRRIPEIWGNALEAAAFRIRPELQCLWQKLSDQGLRVRMTGSGPTLFIWDLSGEDEARRLAEQLKSFGVWTAAVSACACGISYETWEE